MSDPDQLTDSKNLYNIGAGEIMWRNFLAGISRALGGMVIYFLVLIVLGNVFMQFVWPTLAPMFTTLEQTNTMLEQLNMLQQPTRVR